MPQSLNKIISLFISFCLIFEQSAFAQSIDLSHYFANSGKPIIQSDKFRPLHLRYLGYDNLGQDFKLLLDKGDTKKEDLENKTYIEENTQTLLKYFFIGLALPNEKFWVNLRPDSPDNILDPDLEKTDIGRIFLEADVQLKKDTAGFTSPQTKEGREYWDKLYKKAGELFGSENITIPTLTRPWIVPNEIIIREAPDNAYIYKATLKVMLEEDYLKSSQLSAVSYQQYNFKDHRLKELNEYSTQLIKELIIPKLTYQVNTAKRYAPLRQVYYSLILAQWFKQKYGLQSTEQNNPYVKLMDSGDLSRLVSKEPYDKQDYFQQYQKSFQDGEYNLQEPVYTPMGQSIRRYMSGGITMMSKSVSSATEGGKVSTQLALPLDLKYILPANIGGKGGFVNIAIGSEKFLPEFILKLQNLINTVPDVEHKQILRIFLEILQRSPPEFERIISRITRRQIKIRDLDGEINIEYYAQGSNKIVHKVTFHGLKENFNVLAAVKKEGGSGRIQPNEIADLEKLSTAKIKDLRLVPVFGVSATTQNGRMLYLEEFIEGDTVAKYKRRNLLDKSLRKKIVTTLFSIGVLLGNVFPKDVNEGNFVITQGNEVIMVDIGNKRFSVGEALKSKSYNSMVEFLFLTFLHYYNVREKDTFIIPAFRESLDTIEKFMKVNNINNIKPGKTIIEARKEIFHFLETTRNYLANISDAEMAGLKKKLTRGNPYLYSYFKLHNIPEQEQEEFVGKYLWHIKNSLSAGNNSEEINAASSVVGNANSSASSAVGLEQKPFSSSTLIAGEGLKRLVDVLAQESPSNELERGWFQEYKRLIRKKSTEEIFSIDGKEYLIKPYSNRENVMIIQNQETGGKMLLKHLVLSRHEGEIQNMLFNSVNKVRVPQVMYYNERFMLMEFFENAVDIVDSIYGQSIDKPNKYYTRLKNLCTIFEKVDMDDFIKSVQNLDANRIYNPDFDEFKNMLLVEGKIIFIDFELAEELDKPQLSAKPQKISVMLIECLRYWLEQAVKETGKNKNDDEHIRFAEEMIEKLSIGNKGGIAFNALPIQTEAVASSVSGSFSGVKAFQGDLNAEWAQIQQVFNAGIQPSVRRISEYAAAAASSGLAGERIDQVRAMLADILRREEEDEKLPPAEPALKNLITALES